MTVAHREDPLASLGWTVLDWMYNGLPNPSDETKPLILTDEQASFVLDFYSLDARRRDFAYRRAIIEMAKGWGKSPLVAAIALAELAGPVCLDGLDAGGQPVGVPWGYGGRPDPLVQLAAVSEDQTDNTYGALYAMLTARKGAIAEALGIDDGRSRLYLRGRPGKLEPVTSSAGSREGQRLTFAVLDETHLWWLRNGGIKLASTLRRNLAKMNGRSIETTNAPLLGEKSVAERSGNVASRSAGILWMHRQPKETPQPDWTDARMLAALREAYGDASWINLRRILADIRDPDTAWDDALRFFFNVRTVGTGAAVDPRRWDALAHPRNADGELRYPDGDPPAGTRIGLGFDGSITTDTTSLRGCTADGYGFTLGFWQRPPGVEDWSVPRDEVQRAVHGAFTRYDVGLMIADPPKWWDEIKGWAETYPDRVKALDTNSARRFAPAVDRWLTALREGTYTHDGDPVAAEHVKAAHLRRVRLADAADDSRTMYIMVKGEDGRKIDVAVADVLAGWAASTMPAAEPKSDGPNLW